MLAEIIESEHTRISEETQEVTINILMHIVRYSRPVHVSNTHRDRNGVEFTDKRGISVLVTSGPQVTIFK